MPKPPIKDEFTHLPISRQRKYQLRKAKAGKCVQCGKPAVSSRRCLEHLVQAREHMRAFIGDRRRMNARSYKTEEAIRNNQPLPVFPQPLVSGAPPRPHRKRIQDEFTNLPISRQRRYQLRKAKLGLCVVCGQPAVIGGLCAPHMVQSRELQRRRQRAAKRWRNSQTDRIEKALAERPAPPAILAPPLPKPKPGIQDEFTYLPISEAAKARLRKQRDNEWRAKYLGQTPPSKA